MQSNDYYGNSEMTNPESHFRKDVTKTIEQLLRLLAPQDLINWGGMRYDELITYLINSLKEEGKRIKEIDEQ